MDLAGSTLREPDRSVELLEELEPMSEVGPVGLPGVLLVLGGRLNSLRVAPQDSRYGKVWVGSIEEARGLGIKGYIQKPFYPEVVRDLLNRIMEKANV